MSKKVVLVAGVLLAAGAAAAISSPRLIDELADGVGHATQRISQVIGVSDEEAKPAREERRSRRARQRRGEEERSEEAQSAEPEDAGETPREARGKRWRDVDGTIDPDAGAKRGRRRASFAAQDRYGQSFGRLDKNGDGAIDMPEFVLAETERIAARTRAFFKRFDTDGDGKVTREEFGRGSRERFTALEADDAGDATEAARSKAATAVK